LDITFATVGSDPALYRLFTSHVPNLISIFFSLRRSSKKPSKSEDLCDVSLQVYFYGNELITPSPTPQPVDCPLPAVRDCLFNIFAAALHIWRPSPPSATWGRPMPWWEETHLIDTMSPNKLGRTC
jgi:hypothetical protein